MAGRETGSRQADHWQRKYYDSLEELERRKQEWQALEQILRLASRLTLAAETDQAGFNKQLEKLRQALREEHDPHRLNKLVDEVSTAISQLENTRQTGNPDSNPARAFGVLLDTLEIPARLQRQQRYLRKQIERSKSGRDVEALARDVAELIGLISELRTQAGDTAGEEKEPARLPVGGPSAPAPERPENRRGFLSGLFGRNAAATAGYDQAENPVPAGEAEDIPRTVSGDDSPAATSFQLAAETLIRLLEKVSLADDLHTQADLIKRRLEPCAGQDCLAEGLNATAELVADMQQRVQKEKQALEDFLRQLTERLHELDQDLRESSRLREASRQAGDEVNRQVQDEVGHIETSLSAARDLEALKSAVQSRVIIIRDHMDRFMEAEVSRHEQDRKIIARLNDRLATTEDEVAALRAQLEEAQQAAMRDQLTGVPNRLAYDRRIEEELARCRRYGSVFTLLVWDVDKFKSINDTYGHAAGDKVLTVLAKTLQTRIRETDLLARYGGEEFVLIMAETTEANALPVAEKLRTAIEATEFHFRGKRVVITASCGLAQAGSEDTPISLFARADAALYQAKQAGRNRCITAGEMP